MENVPPLADLTQYINPEIHNVHPAIRFAQTTLGANQKKQQRPDTYKTVMCQAWLESTRCAFGPDCKFAHGETELRPAKLPIRNTLKYKTKLCDKYTTTGICPYGSRCLFIHPDPRSTAFYRQTAMAQQLLQQTLGMQFHSQLSSISAPQTPTVPPQNLMSSFLNNNNNITIPSSPPTIGAPGGTSNMPSLAPSPPKSSSTAINNNPHQQHLLQRPPSRPHPSWPLDTNSIFIDELFHQHQQNMLLNHSRSLPGSLTNSRHSSISPYSHESSSIRDSSNASNSNGSSPNGAWTLF